MADYFKNIDIRTRIIAVSVFMILIFIFVALRDFYVLTKISRNQQQILKTIENTNVVLSVKYDIKADHEILREIQLSDELTVVKEGWIEHLQHTKNITDNLHKFNKTIKKLNYRSNEKQRINKFVKEILNSYEHEIKPGFQQISNAKEKYIRIDYTVPDISVKDIETQLGFEDGFSGQNKDIVFSDNNANELSEIEILKAEITKTGIRLDSVFDIIAFKIKNIELVSERITKQAGENTQKLITSSKNTMLVILFIAISVLIVITYLLTKMILDPIENLKERIINLSKGILTQSETVEGNNEMSDIINATNNLVEGLRKTSEFAKAIGNGNFDIEYKPLSSQDKLGNALLNMRKSLKNAKKEETKRLKEEQITQWTVKGRAKFTEIIRASNDLKTISERLVSNMVKYIGANQGGVFNYNDAQSDHESIELLAAYAYNRKKYMQKKVPKNDGLLWTCALEKSTIYITEIPKDYAEIKSGLGSAYPTCILIVPLIINDKVEGLIELASVHEIEKYKIEFVEKISESVATTFASIKMNLKTSQLLGKTQLEAEKMQAQEEELKDKLSILEEKEKKATRKEKIYKTKINKLLYLLDNHGVQIPKEFTDDKNNN